MDQIMLSSVKPASFSESASHWLMLLALILASALYLSNLNTFQVGAYADDAYYVALARGLVNDGVYGYTNVPGEVNLTRYPFGFPLLLTPMVKLFPDSLVALKAVSLVITVINGWLLYHAGGYFGWGSHPIFRVAVPVLYLSSPLVSGHAGMVMSEAAFTMWLLLALFLLRSSLNSDERSWVYGLLLSGVVFAAATTRTLGYTLLVIVPGALVFGQRHRQLVMFAVGLILIFALTWIALPVRLQDFGISIEYKDMLLEPEKYQGAVQGDTLPARMLSLLWLYATEGVHAVTVPVGGVGPTSQALFSSLGVGFVPPLVGLATSGLVAVGILLSCRSSPIPVVLVVMHCGVLLLWYYYSNRFLYPVLPFLSYYLLVGIERIFSTVFRTLVGVSAGQRDRVLLITASVVSATLVLSGAVRSLPTDTSLDHTLDLQEGTDWIKENTAGDSILVSEQPIVASIYAHRSVVGYPSHSMALLDRIDSYRADYVLIRPLLKWTTPRALELSETAQRILSHVRSKPNIFTPVYSNPAEKTYVYMIDRQ